MVRVLSVAKEKKSDFFWEWVDLFILEEFERLYGKHLFLTLDTKLKLFVNMHRA